MSDEWITSTFIGSFLDEPDEALIVLRGDIDAAAVQRLDVHVADVLGAGTRFLSIDAAAVDSYEQGLLDLLGRTQRRLGRRHGLLRVQGLHPMLLRDAETPASEPASAPADPAPAPPVRIVEPPARLGSTGGPSGAGNITGGTTNDPDS